MTIADMYRSISPAQPKENLGVGEKARVKEPSSPTGPSEFQKLLEGEQLNFSKHAETRIRSREIHWDAALEERIKNGLDRANSKGSKEVLILADNVAVIANVKSRTVITAMDRSALKEKIFTNIDSTVLV